MVYQHRNKQEYVLLRLLELLEHRISLVKYCLCSLGMDVAGKKTNTQLVVMGFLGENNYTMKFNTLTCRTLKQAYHFLELALFRIKYPPSDICFTVHVIFKFPINNVESSPITRVRGVKDFFLRCLQPNHIEIPKKVKLRQRTVRKVTKCYNGMQSDLKKSIIRIRIDVP